jgi:ankyrin repeat protein
MFLPKPSTPNGSVETLGGASIKAVLPLYEDDSQSAHGDCTILVDEESCDSDVPDLVPGSDDNDAKDDDDAKIVSVRASVNVADEEEEKVVHATADDAMERIVSKANGADSADPTKSVDSGRDPATRIGGSAKVCRESLLSQPCTLEAPTEPPSPAAVATVAATEAAAATATLAEDEIKEPTTESVVELLAIFKDLVISAEKEPAASGDGSGEDGSARRAMTIEREWRARKIATGGYAAFLLSRAVSLGDPNGANMRAAASLIDLGCDPNGMPPVVVPLVAACKAGNVEAVELLLARGARANVAAAIACGKLSIMPLELACMRDDVTIARALLERGAADVECSKSLYPDGPLAVACARCNPDLVQLLIDGGADPNRRSRDGATMLVSACLSRDGDREAKLRIVRALVSAGARVDDVARDDCDDCDVRDGTAAAAAPKTMAAMTPLCAAAAAGDVALAEFLLESGAKIDCRSTESVANCAGGASGARYTALALACLLGHDGVAQMLVSRGADASIAVDGVGDTPAMYAAAKCSFGTLRALVARGKADLSAKNAVGLTAMDAAALRDLRMGTTDGVAVLAELGADPMAARNSAHVRCLLELHRKNLSFSAYTSALDKATNDPAKALEILIETEPTNPS